MDVFTAVEPKVMPFHGGCGSSGDVTDTGPRGAKVSLLSRGRGSIVRWELEYPEGVSRPAEAKGGDR